VGCIGGALLLATLSALKTLQSEGRFAIGPALGALLHPVGVTGWLEILGIVVFGSTCALLTAAVIAARHGAALDQEREAS
jgi:hypothetical protein